MELIPVESSMIEAVGYDADARTLHVVFSKGQMYTYEQVPPEEFENLLAAESKGGYMRDCIIGFYPYYKGIRRR
jgi:hypothetical protein